MKLAPLADLYERAGPWATAYVDTSLADEATLSRRKLEARRISEELAGQGGDEATCRAIGEAIGAYPHGEGAAGHAVFANGGEVVLDPVLTVPPPGGSFATWGPLPHVAPLVELAPDRPDCLVVYVDRTGADLELRTAAAHSDQGEVRGRDWPVHRAASTDWSERHFQLSVENTWEENARTVASGVEDAVARTGARLVVLAGDERERRTVHERLPDALQAEVVETSHGGRAAGTDPTALDRDIEEYVRTWEQRRVSDAVERFTAARARSDGLTAAADGVPALVEAAREHRIDVLLLKPDGPDAHREVWAGPGADQIAVRRTEARALGEPEPFSVRADDALLRSAAVTGAEAIVVGSRAGRVSDPAEDLAADNRAAAATGPAEPEPEPVGGLGALLRWAAPDGPDQGTA
ncbi:Vms1/Ankzf1 family peptidyl-tRNA hydrolase [Streptomyces sp. NPDC096323]|uniref:baeRF2 domain-containing protein n=1 Tax=Streptomyces sp. NPDC096323 TaxID=3155822 RepID=UPI003331EAC2